MRWLLVIGLMGCADTAELEESLERCMEVATTAVDAKDVAVESERTAVARLEAAEQRIRELELELASTPEAVARRATGEEWLDMTTDPPSISRSQFPTLDELSRSGRVIPQSDDGGFVGYRLAGVRRDRVLDRGGFANGDVIVSVNGEPLTGASGPASGTLPSPLPDEIRIGLIRRGEPMELVFQVVP